MKPYIVPLFSLLAITIWQACSPVENQLLEQQTSPGSRNNYKFTFSPQEPASFPLDSLTGFFQNNMQYTEDDLRKGKFILFNTVKGIMYLYDYESKKIEREIRFEREGDNGLGSFYRMGFLYCNDDSIFMYNVKKQTLFLCDAEGKIKDKFDLRPQHLQGPGKAFPKMSTDSPPFRLGNNFFVHGMSVDPQEDHTNLESFFTLNLEDGQVSTSISRPDLYNEGDWGLGFKYNLYACFNPDQGLFAMGFALDHNILVTDFAGYTNQYLCKSDYFTKRVPYTKKVPTQLIQDEQKNLYSFTTPNYYSLVYDKYNKLYYRFFIHPLKTEEWVSARGSAPLRYPGVIIMDEHFNKVGEYKLPTRDYISYFFVNERGLHIASKEHYSKNEDLLTFNVYKVHNL